MSRDTVDEPQPSGCEVVRRIEPGVPPSVAVANTILEASDRPVDDLEPLHCVIDTDALDMLFATRDTGDPRYGTFTFDYADFRITILVDDTREIRLTRRS